MAKYKVYTKKNKIVVTNNVADIINLSLHRENGPAYIRYYDNGNIKYKEYWLNNILHKLDGPAVIGYNIDGSIKHEAYWVNGKLHRLSGPAMVWYNPEGSINEWYYYINDCEYSKEKYYKELIKLKVQSL